MHIRYDVSVQRLEDGRVAVWVLVPGEAGYVPVPLSVTELTVLLDLARDSIVGGDGCGQWHAWQAHWNGQAWCCPVCQHVLTFPF